MKDTNLNQSLAQTRFLQVKDRHRRSIALWNQSIIRMNGKRGKLEHHQ